MTVLPRPETEEPDPIRGALFERLARGDGEALAEYFALGGVRIEWAGDPVVI